MTEDELAKILKKPGYGIAIDGRVSPSGNLMVPEPWVGERNADGGKDASSVTSLWNHQREAINYALNRKRSMCCVGMGGGKSRIAVTAAVEGGARTIVILCPVSVVGVWRREFAKFAPGAFDVLCLDEGTCADKAKMAAERLKLAAARRRPCVVVCNYESSWRDKLRRVLLDRLWDLGIYDEVHRIKSPGGKASRFATELGKRSGLRLGLTGTPMPHSPLDLYAQGRAIDPSVFGWSYTAFRGHYALTDPQFPSRVLKWLNQDELRQKFASFSYQCSLEGVLDLPPVTEQTITVRLSPKARKLYDALEQDFWAGVEGGEITAGNALVKLLRLQQITGGHATTDDRRMIQVDDGKRRALADLVEDVPDDVPIAVFCRFVADLDTVAEVAKASGRTYGEISGRTKDALDPHACLRDGIGLVGVQTASGGVGIDLTRAAVAVFYSLGYSLGDYLQARARLHRPGQARHVTFVNIVAEGTVDEAVHQALEKRQEVVDSILQVRRARAA